MKIFLDTANINDIKQYSFIIDGVTTNPTLIAKEGRDLKETILEICRIINGPVSVEAISQDASGMIREAREFSRWSKNIVVKIPMIEEGIKAVKVLERENIKTNVTLVFSANQALLAAKVGASYVSPFVGRLDDIGHKGIVVVKEIVDIYRNYNFQTQIITASIRHPLHVLNAARIGAHIATIPPNILQLLFKHNLTDTGLKKFLEDWEQSKNTSCII